METLEPGAGARIYNTSTATVWLAGDKIIRVLNRPGSVHGKKEAQENIAAIPENQKGSGCGLLIDFRHLRAMTREAREVYRTEGSVDMVAIAILVGSPLSRAIGNFFVGLSKTHRPTKLFTSEESAEAWLKEHIAAWGE